MVKRCSLILSITRGSVVAGALCLAAAGCFPRGLVEASPGDSGDINSEISNADDSAAELHGFSANLVGPNFLILLSSRSSLGPVDLAPGASFQFVLKYDISPGAPFGCFRAYATNDVSDDQDGVLWEDPRDNPSEIDFLLLPATHSFTRTWSRLRARFGCRTRLLATVRPDLRARCRKRLAEYAATMEESDETLWFSEADRIFSKTPMPEVLAKAKAGGITAVLELGYRHSPASRKTLLAISASLRIPVVDSNEDVYPCEARGKAALEGGRMVRHAARQALARLGDAALRSSYEVDLFGASEGRAQAAIAAWAYSGGSAAASVLAKALTDPKLPLSRRFSVMRGLEFVVPDEAVRIAEASDGPDARFAAWKDWAHRQAGSPNP